MNIKTGDIVKFHGNFKSTLYENKDDLFEVVTVIESNKFFSGVGVVLKSIPCPYCNHHYFRDDLVKHEFDSGWFALVQRK